MSKVKSLISILLLLISVSYLSSCTSLKNKEYKYEIIETENFVLKKYGVNNVIILDYNEKAEYETLNLATNKELRKYKVVEIAPKSFSYSYGIKELIIPGSVKKIGYMAFYDCINLKTVKLDEGVKELEIKVFYGCRNISKINIPNSLEISNGNFGCFLYESIAPETWEFGARRFKEDGCYYYGNEKNPYLVLIGIDETVKSLTVKEKTKFIYEDVFKNNLIDIKLHNQIKEIYYPRYKTKLESFTTYDNGLYLGSKTNPYLALIDVVSHNISTINIHKDTKIIANAALSNCKQITELALPDNLNMIGWGAFAKMENLKTIEISTSVIQIGHSAFAYCKALESVKLPYQLSTININLFYECSSLKEVDIPISVTTISQSAFFNCDGLVKISLPNNIYYIGEFDVFNYCDNLEEIKLPKHLYSMGHSFVGCSSLEYIIIPSSVRIIKQCCFHSSNVKVLLEHDDVPKTFEENWNCGGQYCDGNVKFYLKDQWSIDENGKVTIK